VVKRLPIRLRSSDPDKEIRLGPEDILAMVNHKCLEDFHSAQKVNLNFPSAIKDIRNIGCLVDRIIYHGATTFLRFMVKITKTDPPQNFFAGFENLHRVVLLCMDNRVHNIKSLTV